MEPREVDALLVGGGVAAARCARTLRRKGFAGSIVLVSDEELPPYNRPPLSKELLRDVLPAELAFAEPLTWYERRDVELLGGVPATALDPEVRTVELADGRLLRYGQLLLATGAAPRRPSLPGAERALLLRTLPDAEAIRARALASGRAVVIGGGFIGVEVASSLAARGMRVTVVELAGALWGGSLGEELSDWAVAALAEVGVELRLHAACESVTADGVRLANEQLAADLVVAGVGVTPRVALAEAAGLEVDDGVLVDAGQRTSGPALFAAGDMARPRDGVRIEHWHAAREAGERAALAMLGAELPPRPAPWVFSEVAGRTLDVVGWAPAWDEVRAVPGGFAYLVGGRVAQLAIIDGALPVEAARALVASRPALPELDALPPRDTGGAPTV
ncbi:MAG TPA: FAD-dependent oxidoreductase [Candidatus Limnocylindria bacterium]|nr:FAD-dependent oxidoreductase [Candidatus Limnocylindria bacterium]